METEVTAAMPEWILKPLANKNSLSPPMPKVIAMVDTPIITKTYTNNQNLFSYLSK